jgi:NhaA family Na+:H+ antiporter
VIAALVIPLRADRRARLEARLHPVSTLVVVPLFALANAGVALDGHAVSVALSSRLTWAVVAGLVLGKPIGIIGAAWLARRFAGAALPAGVTSGQLRGGAALAGIGFTVSLFVAGLALEPALEAQAKVGILAGSLASALLGAAVVVAQERAGRLRSR